MCSLQQRYHQYKTADLSQNTGMHLPPPFSGSHRQHVDTHRLLHSSLTSETSLMLSGDVLHV